MVRRSGMVAIAALLTACSGGSAADVTAQRPTETPTSSTSVRASETPVSTPSVPAAPATTAGSLTKSLLPSPKDLGRGWRGFVDEGNAEDGYVGNGTTVMERKPAEVAQTVLPLGCEARSALPTATLALEADYAHGDVRGVGLRLRFGSSAAAGRFLTGFTADARRCAAQPAPDYADAPPVGSLRTVRGVVITTRTGDDASPTWTEWKARSGRDVLLLAIAAENGSAAVPDVRSVAAALRTMVAAS